MVWPSTPAWQRENIKIDLEICKAKYNNKMYYKSIYSGPSKGLQDLLITKITV